MKGLSLSQAAKRAGVSFQRIDQLYRQGRIRSVDTPLGRLYREADVDKYIAERHAPRKKVKRNDPGAAVRARRGGLKGGPARAAKLTAAQRSEIARNAAHARWGIRAKRPKRAKKAKGAAA